MGRRSRSGGRVTTGAQRPERRVGRTAGRALRRPATTLVTPLRFGTMPHPHRSQESQQTLLSIDLLRINNAKAIAAAGSRDGCAAQNGMYGVEARISAG